MRIFFPIHLDGGNRGCEAIAKGTAMILNEKKENLIGLCTDVELDKRLGVEQYVTLQPSKTNSICVRIKKMIYKSIVHDEWKCKVFFYSHIYETFLNQLEKGDIMFSTGGDMMCYGENQVIYTVDYLHKRGIRSVLWGCSIGENNLTPRKLEALKKFSVIYARESLTKDVLENHGLDNVVVFPDPAFVLEPTQCQLPECFKHGEVIGLNLSNFVMGGCTYNSEFAKETDILIRQILETTEQHILLIPHVMWKDQDDRKISQLIKEKYNSDRISVLESDRLNYCQIRYVISNCLCFIGARTHSVISAYSTCTPAIAIGYSIKSKGIAKDIGMPEDTIVDSKSIKKGQLLNAYQYVMQNMPDLKILLADSMKIYKKRAWDANKIIDSIKTEKNIDKK